MKSSSDSQACCLPVTEVMAGEPELDWSLSLGATGPGPIRLRQGLQTLFSCFHQPCPVLLCTASYCHGSSGKLGTLAPLLWLWFLCSGHTREGLDAQRTVSLCATKLSLSVLRCWFIYSPLLLINLSGRGEWFYLQCIHFNLTWYTSTVYTNKVKTPLCRHKWKRSQCFLHLYIPAINLHLPCILGTYGFVSFYTDVVMSYDSQSILTYY